MQKRSRFIGAAAFRSSGLIPAVATAQQRHHTEWPRYVRDERSSGRRRSVGITDLRVGAQTDAEGRYNFTVPAARVHGQTVFLTARRLGFQPSTVQVILCGTGVITDFRLSAVAAALDEVVVTALGIERKKSVLGTAQQQISSTDLNQTKSQNVINQLQGKVSGVKITGSGTQGGSNRIVLRGANSINGNNSPVFIIDGVAISNRARVSNPAGGYDFGSAIADINPGRHRVGVDSEGTKRSRTLWIARCERRHHHDDQKGGSTNRMRMDAEHAATPGTRRQFCRHIKTNTARAPAGHSNTSTARASGDCDGCDQSYGPKLDGRLIDQFTGQQQPWVAHPDNVKDFLQYRSHQVDDGRGQRRQRPRECACLDRRRQHRRLCPEQHFPQDQRPAQRVAQDQRPAQHRREPSVRPQHRREPSGRWLHERHHGAVRLVRPPGGHGSAAQLRRTEPARTTTALAIREFNWNYNYHNNPVLAPVRQPRSDARDRFIGRVALNYKLADGVNATGQQRLRHLPLQHRSALGAGPDHRAAESIRSIFGGFQFHQRLQQREQHQPARDGEPQAWAHTSALNATGGGGILREQFNTTSTSTTGITVPGIYNVSNAAVTPTLGQTLQRRQVNSTYGSAAFTLNDWWTVEGTARNDWSSTLPQGTNSYFYPSVNASVVLTDAMPSLKGKGHLVREAACFDGTGGQRCRSVPASHHVFGSLDQVHRAGAVHAR